MTTWNSTNRILTPCNAEAPVHAGAIPLWVPEIRGNEWNYIKECLDTQWVSSVGPFVDWFEQSVAEIVGAKHAVATVNGTAALHVALLVAGIRPDDEVLVPTLSFIAPANAIRYVGAWPVLIDAEPKYWQMDSDKVISFLTQECRWNNSGLTNKSTGRRVSAMLAVHMLGHPCDMDPLLDMARKYNLVVIEDAAEALGARYKERMVGHLGDIACFSFNGNKIVTTGGGGMIVTDNEAWANKARYLTTQARNDPAEYIHDEIGYNYRLTNIQAALGCAQIEQLEQFVAAKRSLALRYTAGLHDLPGVTVMPEAAWASSIFWLYTILIDGDKGGVTNRQWMAELQGAGIQSRPLWRPIHRQQPFRQSQTYGVSVSGCLYAQAVSLPSYVGLSESDQNRIIAQARERFLACL